MFVYEKNTDVNNYYHSNNEWAKQRQKLIFYKWKYYYSKPIEPYLPLVLFFPFLKEKF